MNWKRIIRKPFVLVPLLGIILGNYSLGAIIAGMTVLFWGSGPGLNFISLTTLLLIILTGNINTELIFVFIISLAFLIRKSQLIPYIYRIDQKILFIGCSLLIIILYPAWGFLLGSLPVSFLNEINIAGQVLLITGIFISFLRGKALLRKGIDIREFSDFLLSFLTAVIALNGSYFLIPFWLSGNLVLYQIRSRRLFSFFNLHQSLSGIVFNRTYYKLILYLLCGLAGYLLLPIGFFLSITLITIFSFLWKMEKIPLLEMIYFSVIIGIVAGRMGLLL